MEYNTIHFDPNIPVEVELSFDQPKEGEGKYGTWRLYGCEGDRAFFASEGLHNLIQMMNYRRGAKFTICKKTKRDKDDKMIQYFTVNDMDYKAVKEYVKSLHTPKEEFLNDEIPKEDVPFQDNDIPF